MANTFKQIFNSIDKTVKKSAIQAINRAGTSTKAKYAKDISNEIGITQKKARSRAKLFKSNEHEIPGQTLSIGTKFPFAASEFKPKEKKVNSRLGKRWAASYQVKGQQRVQTDKGFIIEKNGKKIILERKGDAKYPTTQTKVNVFYPAVLSLAESLQKHMVERFKTVFDSVLKYNLDK